MADEFEEAYEAYYRALGKHAGMKVRAILGDSFMPAFVTWIEAKYDRLNMMLLDPEEAAHAFLALRYERWR